MHTWNRQNCLCRHLNSGIQTVIRGTLASRKNLSFIIKQVSIILTVLIEFIFLLVVHYRSWINLVSITSNKILPFINVHKYFIFRMKFVLRNVGKKLPLLAA